LICFLFEHFFLKFFAMRWINSLFWLYGATALAQTEGITNLVKRLLPSHCDSFRFTLDTDLTGEYDTFVVTSAPNSTILVRGNTLSALSSG
jgi:alpha-N-acetylglucosaminidase